MVFRRKFDGVARREGVNSAASARSWRSWQFGVLGILGRRPEPGWSRTDSSRNNKVAN